MSSSYPRTVVACALALSACATPALVLAQQRLPTIPPADYTAEQKQAVADFEAARKRPISGPFEVLLHSPQVMTVSRTLGDYLRYKSSIGTTLSELVILITAREWTQDYEWHVHHPIALQAHQAGHCRRHRSRASPAGPERRRRHRLRVRH
jgi:4-carboxymuconolactone decarboxylase